MFEQHDNMSTCRFVNTKGKFCGKKTAQGYSLCKTHVQKIQAEREKQMTEEEFVAPARAPKYITSCASLSDDKSRPMRYRAGNKTINTHRTTEDMIALGNKLSL